MHLSQGQSIPSSKAKHPLIEELVRERIILRKGRIQKSLHITNHQALFTYLHFGDFDFAGIGIYMNQFKCHLGDQAAYFVPGEVEEYFIKSGNKTLYNEQKINFDEKLIEEESLLRLIEIIHKHRKGLEQEC